MYNKIREIEDIDWNVAEVSPVSKNLFVSLQNNIRFNFKLVRKYR